MPWDFEIDFTNEICAKVHTTCDSCKSPVDRSKPQPIKGKDGKSKPQINPAIEATLEYPRVIFGDVAELACEASNRN